VTDTVIAFGEELQWRRMISLRSRTLNRGGITAFDAAAGNSARGRISRRNCSVYVTYLKVMEKNPGRVEHHFPNAGMAAREECSL